MSVDQPTPPASSARRTRERRRRPAPAVETAPETITSRPPAPDTLTTGTSADMNDAIGLIETRGLLAQIEAADAMLKAASVSLVKQVPIGGAYITTIIKGDVASVRAAVDAGAAAASQVGELVAAHVIARPERNLLAAFT
jgi:ethanolamine utilization protein EutM